MSKDTNFKISDSSDPSVYFLFCGEYTECAVDICVSAYLLVQTKRSFRLFLKQLLLGRRLVMIICHVNLD